MPGFDIVIEDEADEPESAQVWVEAQLGARSYRCLLDTGAALSGLLHDDFTGSFESTGTRASSGVMAEMSDELIEVPELKVGDLSLKQATIARFEERHGPRHNLIGMDLLVNHCVHFLFSKGRVEVAPFPEVKAWPLVLDSTSHSYIEVQCGEHEVPGVWDTGASMTCVDLGFISAQPRCFEKIGESVGTDASGSSRSTPLYRMSGLRCGGWEWPPHRVVGLDFSFVNSKAERPMTLILGYSSYQHCDWVFDYPNGRWALLNTP